MIQINKFKWHHKIYYFIKENHLIIKKYNQLNQKENKQEYQYKKIQNLEVKIKIFLLLKKKNSLKLKDLQ